MQDFIDANGVVYHGASLIVISLLFFVFLFFCILPPIFLHTHDPEPS